MTSHWRTDDPVVVDIVENNDRARVNFIMTASRWAERYGGVAYKYTRIVGGMSLAGLVTGDDARPHDGWEPYSNGWTPPEGTVAHREMQEIKVTEREVPGVQPMVVIRPNPFAPDQQGVVPRPFVWDGTAWVEIEGHLNSFAAIGEPWERAVAADFRAARGARDAWVELLQQES